MSPLGINAVGTVIEYLFNNNEHHDNYYDTKWLRDSTNRSHYNFLIVNVWEMFCYCWEST